MNFKTTFGLAVLLCVVLLSYLAFRTRLESSEANLTPTPAYGDAPVSRDLVEDKLGDVVKVVCRRFGEDEWVFERDEQEDGSLGDWRMTNPLDMKAVSYDVDRFTRQLGGLKYAVSYRPGEPGGVTAMEAGLDPPETTVAMTDTDGKTVTVEIGKPASARETYVRLAGSDKVMVAESDLRRLMKSKPIEYRDQGLWNFDPLDVTRVEIDDRSDPQAPVSYSFVKDGSRWMIAAPVTARATTKVEDMLRAMGRLRVIKWQDDRPEKLPMYGLEPGALTIRATVVEELPDARPKLGDARPERSEGRGTASTDAEAQDDEASLEDESDPEDENEVEGPPPAKETVYQVHFSNRSPIGEDTKTYLRIGTESMVATVMKSTADKFKPVMSEWRDMKITTVSPTAATRIELTTAEGSATLMKEAGRWSFEPDGGLAERAVVGDLLSAIASLEAVAFIDGKPVDDPSAMGLDEPQAEIRLSIPGIENVERITVGGYTDAQAKRLVYVRRNQVASIAKVRASDVAALIKGPRAYRDRTIVDVDTRSFQRIALSVENRFADGRIELSFELSEDTWSMVEPVAAKLRVDRARQLTDALADLRAEAVVADSGEPASFGLDAPAATISLTYESADADRTEQPADEGDDESGDEPEVAEQAQQPSETLELAVTEHEGRLYARRSDRDTIYEVTRNFYEKLFAEYRSAEVLDFDDSLVKSFSIRSGDATHEFERQDDRWIYRAEPDFPLDSKKVDNLLLQTGDLKTERYVVHAAGELGIYGLSSSLNEVTITLEDGTSHVLIVSDKVCEHDRKGSFFSAVRGRAGVFLLTPATVERFEVSLDRLETER